MLLVLAGTTLPFKMVLLSVGVVIKPSLFQSKCLYGRKLFLREGWVLILSRVLARPRGVDGAVVFILDLISKGIIHAIISHSILIYQRLLLCRHHRSSPFERHVHSAVVGRPLPCDFIKNASLRLTGKSSSPIASLMLRYLGVRFMAQFVRAWTARIYTLSFNCFREAVWLVSWPVFDWATVVVLPDLVFEIGSGTNFLITPLLRQEAGCVTYRRGVNYCWRSESGLFALSSLIPSHIFWKWGHRHVSIRGRTYFLVACFYSIFANQSSSFRGSETRAAYSSWL